MLVFVILRDAELQKITVNGKEMMVTAILAKKTASYAQIKIISHFAKNASLLSCC